MSELTVEDLSKLHPLFTDDVAEVLIFTSIFDLLPLNAVLFFFK
jgi:hypothetical protein